MQELKKMNTDARTKLMDRIVLSLGGGMVDVELTNENLNLAIDFALEKYRQRSENAVEESYIFMELTQDQNDYILPNEIIEVRQVFRRGFGISTGSEDATQIDPFEIAYVSNYVLMNSTSGGLASYELYMGNLEQTGKMFGYHYYFNWNTMSKRLKIARKVRADKEEILLWVYNYIPEYMLLQDPYAGIWISKYATAEAKLFLGGAYEKFSSMAGPQGGVTLNGAQLKSEANQEKMELEQQLKTYQDGAKPLDFIFG